MRPRAPRHSIILAAGKGKRMQSEELHKVCFPIAGEPAINRAVTTYDSCGVHHHVIVVGSMAEQVMQTVTSAHHNVSFAYQREQIGTANAARRGAAAVSAAGDGQEVLIVAGDKVIEPGLLRQLFQLYYDQECDLAFITGDKRYGAGLGRIITDGQGTVLGNVEAVDAAQRQLLGEIRRAAEAGHPPSAEEIRRKIQTAVNPSKAPVAFRCIWDLVEGDDHEVSAQELLERIPEDITRFDFTGAQGEQVTVTPAEVEQGERVNESVYLLSTKVLEFALENLDTNNAQREEYLSDIITVLAQQTRKGGGKFTVRALPTSDPHAVMGFNNPEELLEIEDYLQHKEERARVSGPAEGPWYRAISAWQEELKQALASGDGQGIRSHLAGLYTDDPRIIQDRIRHYLRALDHAATVLGPEKKVLIVRSPGRVNLLGRHVDHQGGHCNLMTIGYETLLVVHPRDDDQVHLHNVDSERFPSHSFSIGDIVAGLPWEDWISVVNSDAVLDMARKAQGSWSQYVVAAAIRLQKKYPDIKLTGADLVVAGDIPVAAGLSSSSAIVVGAAEALVAVNRLEIIPTQLVDLAGEGEWFVGTRGGSADHAAIKLGQNGKVVKVTFFDFAVEGAYDFPREYVLGVCNSGVTAQKSSGAKDQFNHRVSCYQIGFALIKKLFPQYAPLLHHLRDVSTRNLRVPLSAIYKILLRLPETATQAQLREMADEGELEPFFATHAAPEDGLYPIRGVVLFGLAECERSRRYAELLEAGSIPEIGALMRTSHDGDRVAKLNSSGDMQPYRSPTSNAYLLDLIEDLESQEVERVMQAQLERQPGSYHCSIPQIDRMVDIALSTPGAAGAQLAGAGLGGCMMVLLHRDATGELERRMVEGYYAPAGMKPNILWCEPVAGSGALLRD